MSLAEFLRARVLGVPKPEPIPAAHGCHHPQCPRCGSRFVQLLWVATTDWDCGSWACHHCDKRWTRPPLNGRDPLDYVRERP